jgi:GTP-binding protein YchF
VKVGIIGQRTSGKTTIFNALTGAHHVAQRNGYSVGAANVPDGRVDVLCAMYKPRKTTHAQISLVDFASVSNGNGNSEAAKQARGVDALLVVLGAFLRDPVSDLDEILSELVISDLGQVERALERVEGRRFAPKEQAAILQAAKSRLENGDLLAADASLVQALPDRQNFLTTRPVIAALNIPEGDILNGNGKYDGVCHRCHASAIPVIRFSACVEEEIARMDQDDRRVFLEEYGLEEPGLDRLAKQAYQTLGLISFFTVGDDEVRAWTVRQDTQAKTAAGVIHSDIERGFIRAEVVAYDDLDRLGSMKAVRDAGLFRLEAREYVIKDGDVVSFRFNV